MPELDHRTTLATTYGEALYCVAHASAPFTLRIGIHSFALQNLYREHAVHSAAFITACNPNNKRHSPADNQPRQHTLEIAVKALGFSWLTGVGRNAENTHSEDSLLILGIDKKNACELGRRFEQVAIVWCDARATPELIFLA